MTIERSPVTPMPSRVPDSAVLSVSRLSKIYAGRRGSQQTSALIDVSLEIAQGEFVVLLGPSGCGKTTLLRLLAGLEAPTAGQVLSFGRPLTGPSDEAAVMFQSPVLLPWRTVLRNILLPAEIKGVKGAAVTRRAHELMEMTGLSAFAHHRPVALSGGMRQRVALCRSLLLDSPILFMDEPFGALDALTRESMNEELSQIWHETGKTVVFVTHDIAEAVRLGTRVVVMSPRPGRVASTTSLSFDDDSYTARRDSPQFHTYVRGLEAQIKRQH